MSVTTRLHGDVAILTVTGRLDTEDTQGLEQYVLKALEEGKNKVVFDFTELDYINSSGLRVLVMAYQRLRKSQGTVAVCGLKDYILEVFEISGYDKLFTLCQSTSDLLQEAPPA
ncbi:MAG: STAS domain-containing protein [Desulfovibrio sp.]|nr:STAS domain-containing protein [Desulfovibrio sp.]MCA1985177.1 STAS domain-containing protein [Desulfovibrio sp.]